MSTQSACPVCGPDHLLDETGNCHRCLGLVLPATSVVELAERAGVDAATLRQMVSAGPAADGVCHGCHITLRQIRLRGVPVFVCDRCGASFLSDAARRRFAGAPPSTPAVVPERPTPPFESPAPIGEAARWRWALIPVALLVGTALPTWLVLKNPLFVSVLTLACAAIAIAVPAPTALLVRALVPSHKEAAGLCTAVLSSLLTLTAGLTCDVDKTGFVVAVICGGLFAVHLTTSKATALRALRITIPIVVVITAGQNLRAFLYERAHNGCPDGAHWENTGGRHCELNNKWHGPGERVLDGKVTEQGNWVSGSREGSFTSFHANGKKRGEGVFVNDLQNGPWILFDQEGRTAESGYFQNGVREGVWRKYTEDGNVSRSVKFKNGREEP